MLVLRPVSLAQANEFVAKYHRHLGPLKIHKFSIGCKEMNGDELAGVAIVARPVCRFLDDGFTLEVARVCTNGAKNACSLLYGAACRAARAIGYTHIVTYSLSGESGASLKAAGFQSDGLRRHNPNGWDMPSRPRKKPIRYPDGPKIRWSKVFG